MLRKTTHTVSSQTWCKEAMYVCVVCAAVQSLLTPSAVTLFQCADLAVLGACLCERANIHLYAALAQIKTRNAL